MLTNAPKGTKDTTPDKVYRWHYIEKKFTDICKRYGFSELRTPVFEHTELINRGVGDTTDIVQKEMYTFDDHGGRSLTLKPEGTAPAVRAFVEHKMYAEIQPTKLYYDTACFRYEKPQSGRLREFHQFGVEIFGTPNMMADSDVICLGHDFIEEMGIRDVVLEINSVGCPSCRTKYKKALQDFLKPNYDKLCETCKDRFEKNPMRILDCKSDEDRELVKDAPLMTDYLCGECSSAFEELKKNLDAMGLEYEVNPRIVRGLDYYTKTAFEFVSNKIGAQGTVCGGGRYDNLCQEIGGPPIPGVGFGLGKERLLMLMDVNNVEIPEPEATRVFIVTMGEESKAKGLEILRNLHRNGISAETDTLERNVKGQFKYAARKNVKQTIVIGDEELKKGVVQLKDMDAHEQREVPFDEILSAIR